MVVSLAGGADAVFELFDGEAGGNAVGEEFGEGDADVIFETTCFYLVINKMCVLTPSMHGYSTLKVAIFLPKQHNWTQAQSRNWLQNKQKQ